MQQFRGEFWLKSPFRPPWCVPSRAVAIQAVCQVILRSACVPGIYHTSYSPSNKSRLVAGSTCGSLTSNTDGRFFLAMSAKHRFQRLLLGTSITRAAMPSLGVASVMICLGQAGGGGNSRLREGGAGPGLSCWCRSGDFTWRKCSLGTGPTASLSGLAPRQLDGSSHVIRSWNLLSETRSAVLREC